MTTPRDAIAGLSERLRDPRIDALLKERDVLRAYADELFRENGIVRDMLLNPNPDQEPDNVRLHREKCDAIDRAIRAEHERDALQARVKELEAERDKWDRRTAYDELKAREFENRAAQQCQIDALTIRAEAAESRALRAEQELDTMNDIHRAKAGQLARIGQELDEAIAALKPLSRLEVPKRPQGNAGAYSIRHSEIEAARDLVRRLAGPEKEGK